MNHQARSRTTFVSILGVLVLALAACGSSGGSPPVATTTAAPSTPAPSAATSSATGAAGTAAAGDQKVLLVVEENEDYGNIIGSTYAPRINDFAQRFGLATNVDAGYPAHCPSLAAYLLLTSGDRYGVCDDDGPSAHPIAGDNLYQQVAVAGKEYRQYSQSMPQPCDPNNSADHLYLVRHAPVPYYDTEKQRCPQWDVPSGTLTSGALHDAVGSGSLPAFSFVTPDACNDMHGADVCSMSGKQRITAGDTWLGNWLDQVMAGPDYKSGKLTILVTWDEGTNTDNHLPTIVISPKTSGVKSATAYTHCSTLRTMEDLLGLAPLNCAATATSMVTAFHLG